jgi:hypothetical protein
MGPEASAFRFLTIAILILVYPQVVSIEGLYKQTGDSASRNRASRIWRRPAYSHPVWLITEHLHLAPAGQFHRSEVRKLVRYLDGLFAHASSCAVSR